MKKVCISFIILLLIFSIQVFAIEDWNKENKKREDAIRKAVSDFVEPYMDEAVPENERIISYEFSGYGIDTRKEAEGILKATGSFYLKPYSEENTIWDSRLNGSNSLFLEFSIIDGEYVLDWVSRTPRNYDKFLERFEEYQKNGAANVEVKSVQAEKVENLESSQIEKMSNTIFVVSAIVLIIVCISIIIKFVRKKYRK